MKRVALIAIAVIASGLFGPAAVAQAGDTKPNIAVILVPPLRSNR